MHRLADRYSLDLPVELFAEGERQTVTLHDLSRSGMFVRLARPLAAGSKVRVAISPDGQRLVTTARVTHVLGEADARALGRAPGVGIAFCEPTSPHDQLFALAVEQLLRSRRATTSPLDVTIVVADDEPRLLARMSSAFSEAGFSVATATTGVEVLAACFRHTPDVLVIDRSLPVLDGLAILEEIALDPSLANIPVIVASSDPGDIVLAFASGAADFIVKPYTATEVIARARRLVGTGPRTTDRVMLRGSLGNGSGHLPLPALLTMVEHERMSGRLVVTGPHVTWIDLADGRIIDATSSAASLDLRTTLHAVLDWTSGTFELSTHPGPFPDIASSLSITHLLLEHARLCDEAVRPPPDDDAHAGAASEPAPIYPIAVAFS